MDFGFLAWIVKSSLYYSSVFFSKSFSVIDLCSDISTVQKLKG